MISHLFYEVHKKRVGIKQTMAIETIDNQTFQVLLYKSGTWRTLVARKKFRHKEDSKHKNEDAKVFVRTQVALWLTG